MISVYNSVLAQPALAQGVQTGNSAHVGATVDTALFGNMFRSIQFVISAQAITDGVHTFSVQECTTSGGTYTPVDPTRVQGSVVVTSAGGSTLYALGVHHTLRFVQLVDTITASTTGGVFSAVALGGASSKGPVARA
jgi:hypothetical protein